MSDGQEEARTPEEDGVRADEEGSAGRARLPETSGDQEEQPADLSNLPASAVVDTFDALCTDMDREAAASGDSLLGEYVDRLRVLLDGLDSRTLPTYGSVGAVEPLDSDPPPILADLLGSELAPGSDWAVISPVQPTIAEFLAREADEAEAAANGHVLSDPEQIEYPGGKDGFYVITCSCGYATAPTSPASSARLRADNHKAAVEGSVTRDG